MIFGVIGCGRFGRLVVRFLRRYGRVMVTDIRPCTHLPPGVVVRPLAEVASQRIVILAVPISSLKTVLREISPYLAHGSLVVDVCSVKAKPVRWMMDALPRSVHILGSHPLFGPDSVTRSLRGRTVVLCPVRLRDEILKRTVKHLRTLGLEVVFMNAQEHDRMMAETLLLTQYIGRLVHSLGLKRWPRSTVHYRKLIDLTQVAERDSVQLFRDMWNFNSFAGNLDTALRRAQRRLSKELRKRE